MNALDKLISYISPTKGFERAKARKAEHIISRSYDAADQGRRNGGWFRQQTNAESEVTKAVDILAATGQELCRNNPLASRIKMIWAANIVGDGIRAELNTSAKTKRKRANDDFNAWASSTLCDYEGLYNLYGLQWLIAATTVESGGVFIRKHINPDIQGVPLQLQILEQSMLDKAKTSAVDDSGVEIRHGIQYLDGQVQGYWLYTESESSAIRQRTSKFYKKDVEVIHHFRRERAGQPVGVTWLAQSANTLRKYDTLSDAKLTQQQILACMAVVVEEATSPMGVGSDNSSGMNVDSIEPGMIEYVKAGTKVHTISPPSNSDNGTFMQNVKDDIAIGAGLASSQMTGDYSKLNFASGRMSKIEFFQVLDFAQYMMMLPALNKMFTWFSQIYNLSSSINTNLTVEWTFPPRGVVQPEEELNVNIKKTRAGIISPSKLNKMYGTNLGDVVTQWQADKITWNGLPFDVNPALFSVAGNQLNVDDAASANNKNVTESTNNSDNVDKGA